MSKIKFTIDELELLKSTVDVYNKSKNTVLEEFNKNYPWAYECKPDWFIEYEDYCKEADKISNRFSIAKSIVKKLNCLSDKGWGKVK